MGLPLVAQPDSNQLKPALSIARSRTERRSTTTSHEPSKRIPALDGLRGIAILLVLVRHSVAGVETTNVFWSSVIKPLRVTWSGVDLFFVISGFLIGGILLDARNSRRYFQTFYLRRTFRILPIYYLFLAFYFARHLPIRFIPGTLGDTSPLPVPLFSFVTFTHNFWMASFGWFGAWGIAPTWSLAIEEQFYLTIPFVIRRISTRSLYVTLACIMVAAPVLRAILPHVFQHGAFGDYVLTPCRADALSAGVLCALLSRSIKFRQFISGRLWVLSLISGATFLPIALFTFWNWDQYTPPMAIFGLSCLALFYATILIRLVCGHSPILERALKFRPLMKLGTIAYCTYLMHAPLMQAARTVLRARWNMPAETVWPVGGVVGIAAAILVASISWRAFEKPLLNYGHRFNY
jgi:peptidoglycan/LPS O-acetylase OafA/YrhL